MTSVVDAARLGAAFERAREAFGGVDLDERRLAEYVSSHPARDEALARADDEALLELFLVALLRDRVPGSDRAFERRYLTELDASLARLRLSASELDEVKQSVRTKLLVRDGEAPLRIEEYAGRGRLRGLLQVIATREALSRFRRTGRETVLDDRRMADPAVERWDPGLELLKGRAREAFRDAFEHAVRALEARERNLLRLHLLGGVTLERLATIYGVHRATIVRWLGAAREQVLSHTRAELGRTLGIDGGELESVMNAARSRLDLSVERLFGSTAGWDDLDEPIE